MKTVGQKRVQYVWRVIAILESGHSPGNCGHDHVDQDAATMCPWAPPGWDDMLVCDLFVRQFRDKRIDPPRTRKARAA